MSIYRPIHSAPKDGSIVYLGYAEEGEEPNQLIPCWWDNGWKAEMLDVSGWKPNIWMEQDDVNDLPTARGFK